LLFLYECTTLQPTQLQPLADRLGLTIQAVSHTYRSLVRRGLVEFRDGRYSPTVGGVAMLHGTLGRLSDEVRTRIDRLHVIRSCRAVALASLAEGAPVSLELVDGLLSARPGSTGPSRGRIARGGPKGSLVEVLDLEGILPLVPAAVRVHTLTPNDLADPRLPRRVRAALGRHPRDVIAVHGLEAYHTVRSATDQPLVRFGVAVSAREASGVGVPTTVFVLEGDLPRFLSEFGGPRAPPLHITPLP
jgi:predicted transcriptional regulator